MASLESDGKVEVIVNGKSDVDARRTHRGLELAVTRRVLPTHTSIDKLHKAAYSGFDSFTNALHSVSYTVSGKFSLLSALASL